MYCTRADIEQKRIRMQHLIQIVDDEMTGEFDDSNGQIPPSGNTMPLYSDENSVINARINEAIEDADNEINLYLSAKYVTPIADPVPNIVLTISVDISTYRLYLRTGNNIPETVTAGYKSAVELLKQLQSGKLKLDVPGVSSSLKTTGAVGVYSKAPVFDEYDAVW